MERSYSANDDAGLISTTWKIVAGLAVAVGVIFMATLVVEAIAPTLPDQASASVRPSQIGLGGTESRSQPPSLGQHVEHFHAQFNLKPGVETVPQPATF